MDCPNRLVETEEIQAQAVTARKTVEEQLSQSQTRLKLVLEQAPVLLWSTDRDLRVTSAMGTGFRDLNLPRSERGLSIYEYFNIHDDDIEPIVSHRRALLGESVATQIEWQGRTYDVHMEPFRTKDGAIIGTIGVAFDVSERTRTEAIQSAVYRISEAANAAKDLPELYRHIHKVIGGLMPAA